MDIQTQHKLKNLQLMNEKNKNKSMHVSLYSSIDLFGCLIRELTRMAMDNLSKAGLEIGKMMEIHSCCVGNKKGIKDTNWFGLVAYMYIINEYLIR